MNYKIYNKYLNINECVLSINTTGINRQRNKIFLINIIIKEDKVKLHQFFLDETLDNKEVLKEIYFLLNNKKIFTFNGISFDIPFLNKYFLDNGLEILKVKNYDIFIFLKNYKFFELESLKIKYIYEYLTEKDYEILDASTTKKYYKDYLNNKDSKLKEKILQEGRLSIIYRVEILAQIRNLLDMKSICFNIYGLEYRVTPYDFKFTKDFLNISLIDLGKDKNEIDYISDFFKLNTKDDLINLNYKIIEGLISEDVNAVCIHYPDIFNIKDKYPFLKDNLIPIVINEEIDKDKILEIVLDTLKNIKAM